MGRPDLSNYTIQSDIYLTERLGKVGDAGLIAQRYRLDFMGDLVRSGLAGVDDHRLIVRLGHRALAGTEPPGGASLNPALDGYALTGDGNAKPRRARSACGDAAGMTPRASRTTTVDGAGCGAAGTCTVGPPVGGTCTYAPYTVPAMS